MEILAVDDDPLLLHTIQMVLEEDFGEIVQLENPNMVTNYLEEHLVKVVLLDLNFSIGDSNGAEGLAWIKRIHERWPHISIIVLTAHGFLDVAVQSLKQGATDFLEKPFNNEKLIATVRTARSLANSSLKLKEVNDKNDQLIHQMNQSDGSIIGHSKALKEVLSTAQKVAATDASVLIIGEHGTGKELLARHIHKHSLRANQPFISADLGALTESLFESTLFGHKKGSFTDAHDDKPGLIETSNMGTLLMDEIGSLPLHLQSKLLTALQNRVVQRIGENRPRAVDIRLISSTHFTEEELNEPTRFRQDLLFRINTITIEIPALRKRKDDIHPLIEHYLSTFNKKYDRSLSLAKSDIKTLESYSWPGNVRELRNSIERMVIMGEVDMAHFNEDASKSDNLYDIEKQKIMEIIEKNQGNMSHAAKELGIGRNTLYRKLKKYDL